MHIVIRLVLAIVTVSILLLVILELFPQKPLGKYAGDLASNRLPLTMDIDRVDVSIFSSQPSIHLQGVTAAKDNEQLLDIGSARVVSQWSALWSTDPFFERIDVSDGALLIAFDKEGQLNWPVDAFTQEPDASEVTGDKGSMELIGIARLDVESFDVLFSDATNNLSANITVDAQASTVADGAPLELQASGELNDVPLSIATTAEPLAKLLQEPNDHPVTLNASLGDIKTRVEGSVGFLFTENDNPDFDFEIAGNGLADLQQVLDTTLPIVPPFSLNGSLRYDAPFVVLRRFDVSVGDSTIEGDVKVNPASMPVVLYANIIATDLDIDDLGGIIGVAPDTSETVSPRQVQLAKQAEQRSTVLPDRSIGLDALAENVVGAINFSANSIISSAVSVSDVDLRAELSDDLVAINTLEVELAGGQITGSARVETQNGIPDSSIDLKISSLDLGALMEVVGLGNDAFGVLGGELKLWAKGDDIATMAASLDGGVFAIMTGGEVNALLVELAGVDLLESLTLLATAEQESTAISCAFLNLIAEDGMVNVKRFVADTADTLVLAQGEIDMATEQLDVIVEPHPKDASVLSVQTSANIGGTFKSPTILPGSDLPLRIAAAGVLASITAPLAAIVPLLETGTSEGSAYCDGLVGALDDVRD